MGTMGTVGIVSDFATKFQFQRWVHMGTEMGTVKSHKIAHFCGIYWNLLTQYFFN